MDVSYLRIYPNPQSSERHIKSHTSWHLRTSFKCSGRKAGDGFTTGSEASRWLHLKHAANDVHGAFSAEEEVRSEGSEDGL